MLFELKSILLAAVAITTLASASSSTVASHRNRRSGASPVILQSASGYTILSKTGIATAQTQADAISDTANITAEADADAALQAIVLATLAKRDATTDAANVAAQAKADAIALAAQSSTLAATQALLDSANVSLLAMQKQAASIPSLLPAYVSAINNQTNALTSLAITSNNYNNASLNLAGAKAAYNADPNQSTIHQVIDASDAFLASQTAFTSAQSALVTAQNAVAVALNAIVPTSALPKITNIIVANGRHF